MATYRTKTFTTADAATHFINAFSKVGQGYLPCLGGLFFAEAVAVGATGFTVEVAITKLDSEGGDHSGDVAVEEDGTEVTVRYEDGAATINDLVVAINAGATLITADRNGAISPLTVLDGHSDQALTILESSASFVSLGMEPRTTGGPDFTQDQWLLVYSLS